MSNVDNVLGYLRDGLEAKAVIAELKRQASQTTNALMDLQGFLSDMENSLSLDKLSEEEIQQRLQFIKDAVSVIPAFEQGMSAALTLLRNKDARQLSTDDLASARKLLSQITASSE
jgi:hypothetical protein